jgi:hypothetical protein
MNWAAHFLMILLVAYATQADAGRIKKTKGLAFNPVLSEALSARPHGIKLSGFLEACDAGEKTACNEAAWLMETSTEVTDRARAKSFLHKFGTCEYDRFAFSNCIQEGRVVPAQRACEEGLAGMCRLLGDTLTRLKRQDSDRLAAYTAGCELGNGVSCRKGGAVVKNNASFPESEERALRERGCDLGESTECWKLAQWHARGSHGYTRDHAQYKVLMAETERLDKVAEQRWTKVREGIQRDALNRLAQARKTWAETRSAMGPVYCVNHSTGRKKWVEGTIDGTQAVDWKACQRTDAEPSCVSGQGPAPSSMEALFDRCEGILKGSPAVFEFGFRARPNGGLSHCYNHAEGREVRGESVSTTAMRFGACE